MEINTTQINIFGVPPYLLLVLIGTIIALSILPFLLLKRNLEIKKNFMSILISILFIPLGGKLYGIIYKILENFRYGEQIGFKVFQTAGIVYYGGLIGFITGVFILLLLRNKKIERGVTDSISVAIPLFHFFGRIGCLLGGCCYGIKVSGIGSIKYTNYILGEICTANRVPTQIIEAVFEILMFGFLLYLFMTEKFAENLLSIYIFVYSVYRFFAEFLRGDWDRNVFVLGSGSQITAIVLIIIIVLHIYKERRRENGSN